MNNMTTISRVAVAGASGNLGPVVVDQLLSAGFTVTVLTRNTSTHSFPSSVQVAPVDYESLDSLTDAFKGQDAVVSALGFVAGATQLRLVEAAVKAGVKRFIPSEFGSSTLNEKVRALPVFQPKISVQEALTRAAASNGMTYTLIVTGAWLDWGIKVGFLMDLKSKSITLYDGGDRIFSTSTLPTIGKAVAGVLKHPEETKNRAVFVQDTTMSAKKLAAMGKKATGLKGWKEEVVAVDEVLQQAWVDFKKDKPDPHAFAVGFIRAVIFGEGYDNHVEKDDNELLGIRRMSDDEVQNVVNDLAWRY